jgi:cytochrome c553
MIKKNRTILLIVIALVGLAFTVHAEEGDKRKGKYAYRNLYKTCHEADPNAPESPPINPDSKTQAQWEKVFETKDFAQFECVDSWAKLSDEELKNICAYLVSGAADSPTPAKCK